MFLNTGLSASGRSQSCHWRLVISPNLQLSLDLWIAAHAVVLFEKLILRLLVNKLNRRLCASAVLLISAKLNDVRRTELPTLVQVSNPSPAYF
ncbi:Cdk5 and abl1 enzyme substrate 1 [Fasciola gigantica]|uniref:Cdk5 and abl1 enzyme substrate 1 n=1 Tax=Fasciola gigantica TaxID=46835 RepID=A0A504Z7Q5_FASGI|nr:Cdk5 and abl1 enzyme substrate 1 [Fasciola gigantica]